MSPSSIEAQQNLLQECSQQELTTGGVERDRDPRGEFKMRFPSSFVLRCRRENRIVRADSAHHYEGRQMLELFGNVSYTQGLTNITADHMTYYKADDHVEADGRVIAKLESGSTVTGPSIKFYRKRPQLGTRDRLIAVGGPRFVLVDRDSTTGKTDSTRIDSRTLLMEGDLIYASGNVVITRSNLDATGDSVYANKDPKQRVMRLMRNPKLNMKNADSMELRGVVIEILADSNQNVKQVKSLGGANVDGKELKLTGDTIDMRMDQNAITRAFAFGDSGAFMESRGSTMRGDSLDIQMSGGKPSEIHAIARAEAELAPDSAKTGSSEKDRIKGDTVIIRLENVVRVPRRPAADSAGRGGLIPPVQLDSTRRDTLTVPNLISATGNAKLWAVERPKAGKTTTCPGIQYFTGNEIRVILRNGDIDSLMVKRGDVIPFAMGATSECSKQKTDTTGARSGGAGPARIPRK